MGGVLELVRLNRWVSVVVVCVSRGRSGECGVIRVWCDVDPGGGVDSGYDDDARMVW